MERHIYIVIERFSSSYLEAPIEHELEFGTKKEALNFFSQCCRDAKETSAMPPVAGDGIPNRQPVSVILRKMTKDGYEDIARAHYVGGIKCWSWKSC